MTTAKTAIGSTFSTQTLLTWINRGFESLWLLTVVLVPLAFFSRGDLISAAVIGYVEVPKVALLRTLVGLMAVLWLIEWGLMGRSLFHFRSDSAGTQPHPGASLAGLRGWLRRQPARWLTLAVLLYLASTLLSTLLSASFAVSMWGEVPGEDGYATYTIISYVLLFGVIATHLKTRSQLWRLLGAIVVMGVLVAAFAVIQNYGYDPFDLRDPPNTDRSTSTMGSAILAGAVMLMTIPITLVAATITLRRLVTNTGFWFLLALWTIVLTVQLMGITFIQSRGPWVGTMIALAGLLGSVFAFVGWRVFLRAALPLVLAVALTAVIVYLPLRTVRASDADVTPTATATLDRFTSIKRQVASGVLGGRLDIWKNSWRLMVHRPWFEFDSLSLSFFRPVIGYGPDLFRYVYFLESPPRGPDLIPRESVHAHNFFIHQGVETGFFGLLTSLGIFLVPLAVGGYLLLWKRQNYSAVHKLVLVGLIATLAGRSLEQGVGLARVSDLTVFWVLLGVFAALPVMMREPGAPSAPPVPPASLEDRPGLHRGQREGLHGVPRLVQLAIVAFLVGGIVTLTWVNTINYPRAAVMVAKGEKQSRNGDLQGALSSFDRAIDLAPDVWIHYDRRAAVYSSYLNGDQAPAALECGLQKDSLSYKRCLAENAYSANLAGAEQRPHNFRARLALARSAMDLTAFTDDKELEDTTLRLFQEVTALVPTAWPLYDQLAGSYLVVGQPSAALEPLEKSLAITGGHQNSAKAHLLRGVAYRERDQPSKAVEEFSESIRLDPQSTDAYNNRAMTYWFLGQPQQAIEDLDHIIGFFATNPSTVSTLQSEYAEAYSNRGFAYRELGQPQRAIEDLDEAIRLDPQHAVAYSNRGLAYSDLTEYQRAIDDYDEAIRLNHKYIQAYVNRGVAHMDLGQPEQAALDAAEAIRLDPQDAAAYALRAMAHTLLGRESEVARDLDRAVELGFARASLEEKLQEMRDRR